MATPIGRILLMPRGNFNSGAVYNALDWVRHAGASWVCTTDNTTGIAPSPSTPQWQLMAEDGSIGGWDSLANKPFETLGDGVTKNASAELTLKVDDSLLLGTRLSVAARNTYDSTSEKPISGKGVDNAISGKADKTEIIHWVDATLASGQATYTVQNALFKTTSRIVQVSSNDGGTYSSIGITTDGYFTITFPSALTATKNISIGISNTASA